VLTVSNETWSLLGNLPWSQVFPQLLLSNVKWNSLCCVAAEFVKWFKNWNISPVSRHLNRLSADVYSVHYTYVPVILSALAQYIASEQLLRNQTVSKLSSAGATNASRVFKLAAISRKGGSA